MNVQPIKERKVWQGAKYSIEHLEKQMALRDNVIVLQGMKSIELFKKLLTK